MEILLLLLLLASAGLLYLPEVLKERTLDSPLDTVSDFRRGMSAIATSTHNYQPGFDGKVYYSPMRDSGTEPYIKINSFSSADEDSGDFAPYIRSHSHEEMLTRQKRIIALLLIVMLGTGIAAAIPSLRWVVPLHLAVLVITAGYIFLVMMMPRQRRPRR